MKHRIAFCLCVLVWLALAALVFYLGGAFVGFSDAHNAWPATKPR